MVIIGSVALALHGLRPMDGINNLNLVGNRDELESVRAWLTDRIVKTEDSAESSTTFTLADGYRWKQIDFDFQQSPSDRLLTSLCTRSARLFDTLLKVPPLQVLYLIKRAHANVPIGFGKTIRDLLLLKPKILGFSAAEKEFGRLRKQECSDRYRLQRQRFSLSLRNEDFFDLSNHVRQYEHDDLHEAVAHYPNGPLYKRCKHDLNLAKIDVPLFQALTPEDQRRMVQEEFMVIGLERFYLHQPHLSTADVYRLGMYKTIRDLFVGFFQDFCIDHIDQLQQPPPYDFVERFNQARQSGRIREINTAIPPFDAEHEHIWTLVQTGNADEARRLAEDKARHSDTPGNPHTFFVLGVALLHCGHLATAEQCLRNSLGRDRDNSLGWLYLGIVQLQAGTPAKALQSLETARRLGGKEFLLFWGLGKAYEAIGQPGPALAAYQKADQSDAGHADVLQKIAQLSASTAG